MTDRFTRELWQGSADSYEAILGHPFLAGLTDGSLPQDAFVTTWCSVRPLAAPAFPPCPLPRLRLPSRRVHFPHPRGARLPVTSGLGPECKLGPKSLHRSQGRRTVIAVTCAGTCKGG